MGILLSKGKKKNPSDDISDIYNLYQKICKKTHNKDISDRLIESAKINYPDKNLKWVYEKVLCDLERDNH